MNHGIIKIKNISKVYNKVSALEGYLWRLKKERFMDL